jgi:hypothetical protein
MANSKTSSSGIGLSGVLFIVFLVLKLTGNIDWSWWWVTSPLWIPIVLLASVFLVMLLVVILLMLFGFSPNSIKDKIDQYRN